MTLVTFNGQATSFDLPNYVGDLFRLREQPNNFLRLIGGLSGGVRIVGSTEHTLGVDYELPDGNQPSAVEGAAPIASEIGLTQGTNILQIFQYGVDMTYTRQSISQNIGGLAVIPGVAQGPLQNPGSLAWQIDRKTEIAQNDMNYTFLRGTYQKPANNTTARKTRGVLNAVVTNRFDNAGVTRPLTKTLFEDSLRNMVSNGTMTMGGTIYAVASALTIDSIVKLYYKDTTLPESRSVVGVAVRTIFTTWAVVVLVYEPVMPANTIFFCNPAKIKPVAMVTVANGVQKGIFFAEPLAKNGSADKYQLYGEWGIDYTHEVFHGVLADVTAPV